MVHLDTAVARVTCYLKFYLVSKLAEISVCRKKKLFCLVSHCKGKKRLHYGPFVSGINDTVRLEWFVLIERKLLHEKITRATVHISSFF